MPDIDGYRYAPPILRSLRQNAGIHFDPALVALFINEIPKIKEFVLRLEVHESATGLHPLVQLT